MKSILIILIVLVGCATTTATPARDARLALQRGSIAIGAARKQKDMAAYYKAVEDMRADYHAAMGEAPMFDRWMDIYVEVGKTVEAGQAAQNRGEDPTQHTQKIKTLVAEMWRIVPLIQTDIAQAQRDADKRSETSAATSAATTNALGSLLGGLVGGFVGAAIGSTAPTSPAPAYQAPVPQTPIECRVRSAGRNTVTGQSYGQNVTCQ